MGVFNILSVNFIKNIIAFGYNIFITKNIVMGELKRVCFDCKIDIIYKSKSGYETAIKNNSICRKCAASGEKNGMYGKSGDLNPFYGKSHSEETIIKLKKVERGYTQTKEFRKKISDLTSGNNNPMYGKNVYDIWFEKYGEEIANKKLLITKKKHSDNNSGEGNPMYGKPSPNGSGNGWSGWYNGWFFRSLKELTYMIEVIERFNLKWESAETNKCKIQYEDYKGTPRNYFPDFIIEGKYIIEVKPKKLWDSDSVIRKRKAGELFCVENGLKYKITDITCISDKKILSLYNKGKIKFTNRYEIKFKEWIKTK